MKKIFNKIKNNILLFDLIFICFNILINFILHLINLRFRLWFIIFIILICVIGFIVGIFQQIYKSSENKKLAIIISVLNIGFFASIAIIFMPFIKFIVAFKYNPEHTVNLDDKKYVAVVNSFLHVDVDYYDYYGPLLMGTKIRVHGYFGRGGFDPFDNPNIVDRVEYTYYDENGKVTRNETFIKDDKPANEFNENDNYLLPEDEEILYENKFSNIILRVGRVDYVSGQNMLVNVLKSTDGTNFYVVSDEVIQVSNEAKFIFLNEKLGFAISTAKIYFDNNNSGLYVTNNGGETFTTAKFKYKNNNASYISIESMPYYENNKLKLKCSVYQINKNGYEVKELIFVSNDSGLNWILESN